MGRRTSRLPPRINDWAFEYRSGCLIVFPTKGSAEQVLELELELDAIRTQNVSRALLRHDIRRIPSFFRLLFSIAIIFNVYLGFLVARGIIVERARPWLLLSGDCVKMERQLEHRARPLFVRFSGYSFGIWNL